MNRILVEEKTQPVGGGCERRPFASLYSSEPTKRIILHRKIDGKDENRVSFCPMI